MIGAHGQIVRKHAILAAKQDHEPVHMIRITLASHSPKQKVAIFKNAVMIGHRGRNAVTVLKQDQEFVQADKKTSNKLVKMRNPWGSEGYKGEYKDSNMSQDVKE